MVNKNPFATSSKRRTLSRRLTCHCQRLQSIEDFTRANTEGSPQAANKARLDFAKKTSKKSQTAHDPKHIICETWWSSVMA